MALDVTEPMPNVVRMALLLPGWDRYSVWGWDATGGHLFARLWGNADDPDMPPTIRIGHGGPWRDGAFSGGSPLNVDGLAELIAKATGTGVRHVLLAMGAGAPEVLEARLQKLATYASPSVRQQPSAS
jgi:hypothetical protein